MKLHMILVIELENISAKSEERKLKSYAMDPEFESRIKKLFQECNSMKNSVAIGK